MSAAGARGHRRVAPLAVAAAALLAACSSPSSTTPAPARPHGHAVLGASVATWESAHPPVSAGRESGYGRLVDVGRGTHPQFTDVQRLDGRIVGWRMAFPARTAPAAAVGAVRHLLPGDARQTASWRAPGSSAVAFCEVVDYRSALLASDLGRPLPPLSTPNIGVQIHERAVPGRQRSVPPPPARVEGVLVSTTPPSPGGPCSSAP